ncbi:hypothetical protein ACS0TY_024447 [Phlomoides rotata]
MSRSILTSLSEEPDDEASSANKDVSDAQMVPYEVSIGLILIVRLVSAFGSTKAIIRAGSFIGSRAGAQGSWYYPGVKNPGVPPPYPMLSHKQRLEKYGRAACRETCMCGSGRGPRSTVLICVGPRNSSEIVMAQKQIWSEAEAESVAGYNVEYVRDAILNSSILAKANVPGSRGPGDSF